MRVTIGFIVGAVVGFFAAFWMMNPGDTGLDQADIIVHIKNDTDSTYSMVQLHLSNGQLFTCTLKRRTCTFLLEGWGDIGYSVSAVDESGTIHEAGTAHKYYAEPGASHTIHLSMLSASST